MLDRQPPPRPRQPSQPRLEPALDQQPERRAVHHPGVDGVEQAAPMRRGTLPGGMAAMPGPPPLPLEHSKTVPSAAHEAHTQRVPSPVDQPAVHVADAPYGQPAASRPPPVSQDPRDAQIAALIRQRDELLKPARGSEPPARGAWAKLGYKVATAVVAALVLIIAALGFWAVTAINAKSEAIKAAQEAKKRAETRDEKWKSWASVVIWIADCRDRRDVKTGEMLLPDAQKMGSVRKPEAWQNPCPTELPPAP